MKCLALSLSLSVTICVTFFLSTIDAFSLHVPARLIKDAMKPLQIDVGRLESHYRDLPSDVVNAIPMERESFKNPEFCHGLDCPVYKVVNKTANYELREYEASRWVTTEKMNMEYDEASGIMFMRLFDYIQGSNEKKEKIAMTAPVITRVIPGQGPACENNFTMSFFMAPKVKDPPAPTDKTVYLSSLPKQRVFVSYFGGREHGKDWIAHATSLAENLQKDKRKFDSSIYYTAGYDSPFRLLFRHNEIWFMAKE